MANTVVDNWVGPKIVSIDKCWIENIFSNTTKQEYRDGFKEAYRNYLIELGIKDTRDFDIIEKVVPGLLYKFLYDFKNKKVIKLCSFRSNLTESLFKELLDKCGASNEIQLDIYEMLEELNIFEKDSFDVNFELIKELSKYNYWGFSSCHNVFIEYDFDISSFNKEDLLEPDFPFERQHIGVGIKYQQLDKSKDTFHMLDNGTLINGDDNGEECIYIYLSLDKVKE